MMDYIAFYHEVVIALLFIILRFSGCDKEMNTFGSTKVSKHCVSILNFKYNNGNICICILHQRCLAEQEMYDSVWKTCRDADESKFDFSSPSLKRKRVVRDKCANKTCKKETNYNPIISMPYIPDCTNVLSLEETRVNEVYSSPLDVVRYEFDYICMVILLLSLYTQLRVTVMMTVHQVQQKYMFTSL